MKLIEEARVSEVPENKDVIYNDRLLRFVEDEKIQTQQSDFRPWGGYVIVFGVLGKPMVMGKPYGASITTHQAVIDMIYTHRNDTQMKDYLGTDRMERFESLLKQEGF